MHVGDGITVGALETQPMGIMAALPIADVHAGALVLDSQQHHGQQHDGQQHDGQQHGGQQYNGSCGWGCHQWRATGMCSVYVGIVYGVFLLCVVHVYGVWCMCMVYVCIRKKSHVYTCTFTYM